MTRKPKRPAAAPAPSDEARRHVLNLIDAAKSQVHEMRALTVVIKEQLPDNAADVLARLVDLLVERAELSVVAIGDAQAAVEGTDGAGPRNTR